MLPPRTPPPPRLGGASPSPAGRALAILSVALLLVLALLFGPAIWALNKAIIQSVEVWKSLVGATVLLFLAAVLVSIVGLLFAQVRRAFYRAQQAAMLKAPSGMPIHVGDVRDGRLAAQLLPRTLDAHFAQLLAEKQRATPELHSQSIHIHQQQLPPPEPAEVAPPQLPQLPGGSGGTLAQLRQIGHVCRSGNSLLVGYSDAQPQYIELPECGFIGIGGQPRVGKSTTTLLLIEQAILSGWHVFIGDPHIQKADGLLNRCRPLSGRLAKQAVTPEEIAIMVRTVDKIGRRRVNGDADRTPVLLIVDEFSNLVWRDLLPADVLGILPSMAAEYAGVGVHGVLIAHDWSKASLGGDLGAALRRAITHRLIHRMDPGNTEFLLPKGSSTQARAVAGLEKGHALFYGPDGAAMVAVPWLTDEDAAYAAQGTPPRPYVPRPQLAAPSPIPPTARVAPPVQQPAPPTVPMNITVPEQIIDLLDARAGQWMTVSEIAAALRLDLQVARTEVSGLASAGQLASRKCSGRRTKERLEYQINPSTNQPINALSA